MRSIFLTGGAGFLGKALMSSFQEGRPDVRFTVYSRDEGKHAAARRVFPDAHYILGDVRDLDRLQLSMAGHDTVIHCAAMKYVPQGEHNASEAIEVNVNGSRNVAQAAINVGVERVVGISTDKACMPVNVYGVTKFLTERVFQEADAMSDTQFNLCRYGNVIASTGSVIPTFVNQIRDNGSIRLVDGNMTRFWLSIADAVELVMLTLGEGVGGTILIPTLSSMSMRELAASVFEALNLPPSFHDVSDHNRGGEKIHESLLSLTESGSTTQIDNGLLRLYPLTTRHDDMEGVVVPTFLEGYSSDAPQKWFTIQTMTGIIMSMLGRGEL